MEESIFLNIIKKISAHRWRNGQLTGSPYRDPLGGGEKQTVA
jgi:hypothetical protein